MDPDKRVRAWLDEDVGEGDITTDAVVPDDARAEGRIVARESGVVAGLGQAARVFEQLGLEVERVARDGDAVDADDTLLVARGPAGRMLTAERLALNLIMHLSGIATATHEAVERARTANPDVQVLATRKTMPGLREIEHEAVVAGGGTPHRARLDAAFLVKENHLKLAASITDAVRDCREADPDAFLMVEAETPEEALEVARAGADGVLLDNFAPGQGADTAELVRNLQPGILVEASGGITAQNIDEYAAWADRVSLGALTHSVRALDVSLQLEPLDANE